MPRPLLLLILVILLCSPAGAKDLKRDPETGVIRLIYIGMPFAPSPYQVLRYDPLLFTLPIQGNLFGISSEKIQRSMRLYMPRTKDHLVEHYDIIGLDDTTYTVFPLQTIHWMVDGCRDDALGLFMAGGYESFGGRGHPSWDNTVLSEVIPVISTSTYGEDGKVEIVNWEDEFIRSVPWDDYEQHNIFGGYNIVLKKDGANELSQVTRLSLGNGQRDPGWVWWDVGRGRFFASAPGFRGGSADRGFIRWSHYPDFVTNMVYFVAGLTPPSDVMLMHNTRAVFRDIQDQRQTIVGLIDFISKFGADTRQVDSKLGEAEEILEAARARFVDLELEASRELADEVATALGEAYSLAFQARDAALFWIFLTEWIVVTATGLVVGAILWTLMIRRRLYREVHVTRTAM